MKGSPFVIYALEGGQPTVFMEVYSLDVSLPRFEISLSGDSRGPCLALINPPRYI